MTLAQIEHRLSAVEAELSRLKLAQTPRPRRHPVETLDAIHGTFADDDAFEEAMRLGRKWRKSQDAKPAKIKSRPKSK